MLTWDAAAGMLTLDHRGCQLGGWSISVEADGRTLTAADGEVQVIRDNPPEITVRFAQPRLEWTLTSRPDPGTGTVLLESVLANRSDKPIALGKVCPLYSRGPISVGEPADDVLVLPMTGTINDRYVSRLGDPKAPRTSRVKVQFHNRAARTALQVGFVTFQRANTVIDFTADAGGGLTGLSAYCDFAGWELPPGESEPVETLAVMAGDDPFRQLEHWADLAAARCRPRQWEDPPIGWVGWSWVDGFNIERYEDVVLRNAAAVRRRLKGFPVDYVWISIGNLESTAPGNWLNWNRELFPSGPEMLSARLGELGMKWGLWCGPFWICESLERMLEQYRDALLVGADGLPVKVRPEWSYGPFARVPAAKRPGIFALEPTHPKTLKLLREVFTAYRRWGVRYYMIDFLDAGCGNIGHWPHHRLHDKRAVPGPQAYLTAMRAIREAAGDDTHLLSSTGPTVHNAGIVDSARTGCDFGEGRPIAPESGFYPATFAINARKVWTGPLRALRNLASCYYTHRKLFLNNAGNVLTVDKPLAFSEAQIHATIHALSGGPTMLGDDIDRIDEERLAMIKKTLPRSRHVAFPVDLFEVAAPEYPRVFHRKVSKAWGLFDVVAVFNFGDGLLAHEVPLGRLGLSPEAEYLVWEFWECRYRGRCRGSLRAVVPPLSVRVYRLTECAGRPTVAGTDMHLMMGEMEIDQCRWDQASRTLSGRCLRPAGERGNVFIWAPGDCRPADPRGLWTAKDPDDNSLVIRAALDFADGAACWSVSFAALESILDVHQVDLA